MNVGVATLHQLKDILAGLRQLNLIIQAGAVDAQLQGAARHSAEQHVVVVVLAGEHVRKPSPADLLKKPGQPPRRIRRGCGCAGRTPPHSRRCWSPALAFTGSGSGSGCRAWRARARGTAPCGCNAPTPVHRDIAPTCGLCASRQEPNHFHHSYCSCSRASPSRLGASQSACRHGRKMTACDYRRRPGASVVSSPATKCFGSPMRLRSIRSRRLAASIASRCCCWPSADCGGARLPGLRLAGWIC